MERQIRQYSEMAHHHISSVISENYKHAQTLNRRLVQNSFINKFHVLEDGQCHSIASPQLLTIFIRSVGVSSDYPSGTCHPLSRYGLFL